MPTVANSRHLVITDSGPAAWVGRVRDAASSSSIVDVLPLGMSQDRYRARHGSGLEGLQPWKFADVTREINRARAMIRDCVPQLMMQLRRSRIDGAASFLDQFQRRGFNAWWFLEISEKSAYRGLLINRMYYLALVQSVLDSTTYQNVWLCLEDEVLSRSLSDGLRLLSIDCEMVKGAGTPSKRGVASWLILHLWNALGIGILHALQLLLVRGLKIADGRLPRSRSVLLFSFYPRMWSAPYSEEPSEWFFGALPKYFSTHAPHSYAIWLTAWPREIWAKRSELRSFFLAQNVLWLAPFAGTKAIASLFDPKWWILHVRLSGWQQRSTGLRFGAFDASEMVCEELHRSLSSTEFSRDLLLFHAWKHLTSFLPVAAVLYRLEFQPFENAILYGTRGKTRAIAFQHSLFGKNYLPYHFVSGELGHSSDPGSMPLADVILASGEAGRTVMLKNGCRPESVEVCGPLRYRDFFRRFGQPRERHAEAGKRLGVDWGTKILVVATAVSRPDAEGLFEALGQCAGYLGNMVVMFRSHPALALEKEFKAIVGSRLGSSQYRLLASVEELYDALSLADIAVVNHSTVALEALVLGVLPVIFDSGAVFDPKALESDEWAGMIASNAEELSRVLETVADGREDLVVKKQELLRQAGRWFDQPEEDPYPRFLEALSRHGMLHSFRNDSVESRS